MMNASRETRSTRPYLIRALHEWCCDNGFTPYIVVRVDESVQVPREFVKNGEIVLNVSFDATSALKLGPEYVEFRARFGGVAREVLVPVSRVMAIYARENGQGMAFPLEDGAAASPASEIPAEHAPLEAVPEPRSGTPVRLAPVESEGEEPPPRTPGSGGARPALKRVK